MHVLSVTPRISPNEILESGVTYFFSEFVYITLKIDAVCCVTI